MSDDPNKQLNQNADDRKPAGSAPDRSLGCTVGRTVRLHKHSVVDARAEVHQQSARASSASGPAGTLGEYELIRQIGNGGMGVVYKARDKRLGRIVALKVTRAPGSLSGADSERFRLEAAAAAKLDHPNIVPIYEHNECDGQQYISMAFVSGETLAEAVVAGPLPPRQAVALMRQVAGAVGYAHSCGVIHRDLKPENIMLEESGQPRITDFGLARCTDEDSRLTRPGEVFGTPSYMPPEQIYNMDLVGPRSDVYSLGATLYCLLTGRPPFQSANTLDTVNQVADRDPIPPRQLNPAVQRDLETICLKCLEKRPERRYASAADLEKDLGHFLEGRPICARRTNALEKAGRWCRRNPAIAASIAGVLSMFMTAFILVSWSYWHAEEARQVAVHKSKLERWERYRSHIAAAASALQLNNLSTATRFLRAAPKEFRGWEWRHFTSQLDGAHAIIDIGLVHGHAPVFALHSRKPQVAVGAFDGTVQLYDLASGKLLASNREQKCAVRMLAFSQTDNRLAAGYENGTVRVWNDDLVSSRLIFRGFRNSYVERLMFDRAGTSLMATGFGQGCRIWKIPSGKELYKKHTSVGNMDPSPDFQRLVYCQGSEIIVLNRKSGMEKPITFTQHQTQPSSFAFDPASRRIASGGIHPENAVRVWDSATSQQLLVLTGHKNAINHVQFNSQGTRIASASADQTIRLWHAQTGAQLAILVGHTAPVHRTAFNRSGSRLASSSADGTVRLWDAESGACLGILRGHRQPIFEVEFSADGNWLVTRSDDNSVRIWNVSQCEVVSFRGHRSYVYDVAYSPNGKHIASSAWDGKVIVWDCSSRHMKHQCEHEAPIVSSVSYGPHGKRLATLSRHSENSRGRTLTVWDAITGRKISSAHLPGSNYKDGRAVFDPQRQVIALGDVHGGVHLFAAATGAKQATLSGHKDQILDVAISPQGHQVAAGGIGGKVTVWRMQSGKQLAVLNGHKHDVSRILYHPKAPLLATASTDKTVRLWNTNSFQNVAELLHGSAIYGLAFHPDGSLLATASADNTIHLWDLDKRQKVAELRGHTAYVHALSFSPDGAQLVSASGDHTIRIWDTVPPRRRARRSGP